ncbi:hypothetical protein PtA15_2A291 [Puccinia triticina]|uniref:Uncharacterized protein n=1 Tax=Puccinia triticina TaxID=208348 RepID=A0ABY7CAL5_9BASI|nr:uncharacterized protein PtA15_2A291 [Puccinia triticina]WAQ81978.1 hypothetical protein PtA15_2A291 [Puccinia triticina]
MSPLDAIEEHQYRETPLLNVESPVDNISQANAVFASFLADGIQAELSASQ